MPIFADFDIGKFLWKTNNGRDRRPNFAASVVCSASYALAETSFYGQLADYY